jgi:histone acetyltransferase 1
VTFLPFLRIAYAGKIDSADVKVDIQEKLLEWLPEETVLDDEAKWETLVKQERESIATSLPLSKGELITTYATNDQSFNIHKLKLDNEHSVRLLKRLQIFVPLFIEAGSYIDSSDPLWDLFLITNSETTEIVGFATTYTYFNFTSSEEFDQWDYTKGYPHRKKISQFVVFPPYQSHRHGSKLYDSLIEYWNKDELVREVTVEDPNEKFDDLRYRSDFERLYKLGFINKLPLDLSKFDSLWFQKNAKEYKIELQQFKKIVELGFIYDEKNLKIARLLIKKRLFDKNKEGLLEFEKSVRNDKLQVAYENIKSDYLRIIHSLNLHADRGLDDDRVVKKQKI